jgi:hypothetical protein
MPAAAQKIPAVPQELRVAKDYANWHLADLRVSANVRFAPKTGIQVDSWDQHENLNKPAPKRGTEKPHISGWPSRVAFW